MIFMHYFLLPARICCCKFYNNLTGKGIICVCRVRGRLPLTSHQEKTKSVQSFLMASSTHTLSILVCKVTLTIQCIGCCNVFHKTVFVFLFIN